MAAHNDAGKLNDIANERLGVFRLDGAPILCRPFGNGHINNTFLVLDDTARLYILQKINQNVFKDPLTVMQNIMAVTAHLSRTVSEPRNVPELVPALTGGFWHVDGDGEYWRMYSYIADSVCYQRTESIELFRESGAAFGAFQQNLTSLPAHTLSETIPNFHNTPGRYKTLHSAINDNSHDRVKDTAAEIEFALNRETYAATLMNRHAEGALPLRVTHNDTKLNNVLFDRRTGKSLCVVDLDTVMPGFSVNDFGDSIRFGATTADEDEKDLSKVTFSLRLFEAYAEGFLSACGEHLDAEEINSLCDGAAIITLETGIRFLTDYLMGDTYFRIGYEGQNLDRCRTQFKLVKDMEGSWDKMQSAIGKIHRRG